jgi:uncharacterized protein Yka (UPF0111/DUF47 family)
MTDHQLYIVVAIPFFFAVLLWLAITLSNRSAIAAMSKRLDDEYDSLSKRVDTIAESLNKRIDAATESLNTRIEDLRSEVRTRFTSQDARTSDISRRIGRLETESDKLDDDLRLNHGERISTLEARLVDRVG